MHVYDDGTFAFRVDGEEREFPFLVVEYLPYTLAQVIRGTSASITEKVIFATQLLAGPTYLDPAVVHRDVN